MELSERIETINKLLIDSFGVDTVTGQPMWRIVWANDVTEKRRVTHSDSGVEYLHSKVEEVRKYHDVRDRYILERLIGLEGEALLEYPGQSTYYNPTWVFQDRYGHYLPPYFEGCKYLIDATLAKEGKLDLSKAYNNPDIDPRIKKERVNKIVEELFGEDPGYTEKNHNTVIGFHPKG